tara:strand:- start:61 stop:579 length:519 start_codon:yes stop_codon:yes gene_type:complete
MNKNLKNMISASINDDKDSFKASFEAEINDRISSEIAKKHIEVSQNIMKDDVDEAFSKKAKSNKYTFKSSGDVKKFIKAVQKTGLKKTNLKVSGNSVVVKDLDDGDMGEVIYFMAKDMNAESVDFENQKSINNLLERLDGDAKNLLVNGIIDNEDVYRDVLELAKELSNDIN